MLIVSVLEIRATETSPTCDVQVQLVYYCGAGYPCLFLEMREGDEGGGLLLRQPRRLWRSRNFTRLRSCNTATSSIEALASGYSTFLAPVRPGKSTATFVDRVTSAAETVSRDRAYAHVRPTGSKYPVVRGFWL